MSLIELWRDIVGEAVNYFSDGTVIQWDYGELLEYAFVSIAAIVCIALVFRFLFMLIGLFGHKH